MQKKRNFTAGTACATVLLFFLSSCAKGGGTSTPGGFPSITQTPASKSSWVGAPGNLAAGTWNDPATKPDPAHHGAYGGVAYAPNGDLYLFYSTGTSPNDTLQSVIRRNNGSGWSAEYAVGSRERTANAYFTPAGKPYVCTESGGSAFVHTSSNFSNDSPLSVSWSIEAYFQASDGNPDGIGARDNAFLTADGASLNLFFAYLNYNAVVGSESYGVHSVLQSAGAWPQNGSPGNYIDPGYTPNYALAPNGVSGAFQDGRGNILLLSTRAYLSSDHGNSFSLVTLSGTSSDNLNGVSGAAQNATDASIVLGNFYRADGNGAWQLGIWGTKDSGAHFTELTTMAAGGTPYRARFAAVKNLIVGAITIDGGNGESKLYVTTSYDGGVSWSALSLLVDAAAGGSTYTLGSLSLTANSASGSVALAYSLVSGSSFKGVYLKELY